MHSALLDIVPRVAQFTKQARQKGFLGFNATQTAGGLSAQPGEAGRMAAQSGGTHPLEQGPGFVHAVAATAVGRVIGPGGTQIRDIRDKTGACTYDLGEVYL